MIKWRIPQDTDFTDIPDDELKAACLWEMLRGLSSTKRRSINGRDGLYANEANRVVRLNFSNPKKRLPKSWTELPLKDRKFIVNRFTASGADIVTGESVQIMNRAIHNSNFDIITPVPDELCWSLSLTPAAPGKQCVGLTIDWSKGLTAIRNTVYEWIETHAPAGTKGTRGFPDKTDPVKGRQVAKPFNAVLGWVSITRKLECGVPPRKIANTKTGPCLSSVRQARKKLAARYPVWLGVTV